MAHLEPVHLSADCSIAVMKQVLLQHWFGSVHMPDAQATLRAHDQALEAGPAKVSVLVVVDGLPRLPEQPVREALARLADATKHQVACHATVVLAQGFMGSALRSVMTAIFALSGAEYPKRVFSNVTDAVDWVAEYTSGLSRTEMVVGVEELMTYSHLQTQAS